MPSATDQELDYEEQLNQQRRQQAKPAPQAPASDESALTMIRNAKRAWALIRYLPGLTFYGLIWTVLILNLQLFLFNLLNVNIKLPFVNASSRDIGKLNLFEMILVGIIDAFVAAMIMLTLAYFVGMISIFQNLWSIVWSYITGFFF